MMFANATNLYRKSRAAQWRDLCVDAPSWRCFSTELPFAWGPPKVMKNASVQQLLSIEPLPFPLSSRAQARDLRFRGPFLEMFFDRVAGLGPTQGDEKRLGPATTLYRTVTLPFVIPSEAEGSAVPRTSLGNVFRSKRNGSRQVAASRVHSGLRG